MNSFDKKINEKAKEIINQAITIRDKYYESDEDLTLEFVYGVLKDLYLYSEDFFAHNCNHDGCEIYNHADCQEEAEDEDDPEEEIDDEEDDTLDDEEERFTTLVSEETVKTNSKGYVYLPKDAVDMLTEKCEARNQSYFYVTKCYDTGELHLTPYSMGVDSTTIALSTLAECPKVGAAKLFGKNATGLTLEVYGDGEILIY